MSKNPQAASLPQPAAGSTGETDWPYQKTFNAIAAAVEWREHRGIGISVEKFAKAFGPRTDAPAPAMASLTWQTLAKALFHVERSPTIHDQAWFDFQGKAQLLLAALIMGEPNDYSHGQSCSCHICIGIRRGNAEVAARDASTPAQSVLVEARAKAIEECAAKAELASKSARRYEAKFGGAENKAVADALQELAEEFRFSLSHAPSQPAPVCEPMADLHPDWEVQTDGSIVIRASAETLKEISDAFDRSAASPQPDRESDAGPLLAALIEISNFPYAGAPDIQMRKIARAAVERFTSSNRPQATEGLVEAIIERAEQACRYALKHQNFEGDETEYQRGWEIAAEVCGGAIRAHVLRHLDEDAPNLEIPKWNSRVVTAALSASVAIMERLLRSPKLWPAQHDEARELLTLLNTHSLTEADNG